jgi:hypothetical protein
MNEDIFNSRTTRRYSRLEPLPEAVSNITGVGDSTTVRDPFSILKFDADVLTVETLPSRQGPAETLVSCYRRSRKV